MAGTATARAGDGRAFIEGRTQPLAAHLQQAELADRAKLHPGAVLAQRIAQAVFHFAAVLALLHVDEVDHDQPAQVAQARLPRHFVGGFQVGAGGGFLDVAALDGARRVHVHRHQRFGLVDHDRAAAGQLHGAAVSGFNLVFDLETAEQRRVVAVALDAVPLLRHHVRHELVRLLVNVVRVDQDFADIAVEVIAYGANHEAGFLVDQECPFARFGRAVDRAPEFEQIIEVPLQFAGVPAYAGGARNDAHAMGVIELIERGFQFGPVFAFDPAADAPAAGIVGHQHHIAPGQADKSGQGGPFVAALFFFHLNQQFLAFTDDILNAGLGRTGVALEILPGNFLEWQKAVAFFAVIDETGFQRRLDPRHHGFIDIAFALFTPLDFDLDIEQFLPVHNRQPPLFGLGGVDQHALHFFKLSSHNCPSMGLQPWPASPKRTRRNCRRAAAVFDAVQRHVAHAGVKSTRAWARGARCSKGASRHVSRLPESL